MRLLIFTLLAIAAGVGIQLALTHLPYGMDHALGRFTLLLMLVLPVIATAGHRIRDAHLELVCCPFGHPVALCCVGAGGFQRGDLFSRNTDYQLSDPNSNVGGRSG